MTTQTPQEEIERRKHYFMPCAGQSDTCAICLKNFRNTEFHCTGDERPETDAEYIARLEAALRAAPASGEGKLREALEQILKLAKGPHPPRALEDLGDIYGIAREALSTTPADPGTREACAMHVMPPGQRCPKCGSYKFEPCALSDVKP